MNRFFKNYGFSLLLLAGVLAGGVCGLVFGERASVVRPLGDLFLNLMFVLVVPLVFFSMATSFCKMKRDGIIGRMIGISLAVFVGMSFLTAALSYGGVLLWKPLCPPEMAGTVLSGADGENPSFGAMIVSAVTVPEFLSLFNKANLLPLIVFSSLLGYATALCGEKGRRVAELLQGGLDITVRMVGVVMYLAPVCLGCYMADTIGRLGAEVAGGYIQVVLLYLVMSLVVFFGLNSLLVGVFCGGKGLKAFWGNILTPTLTAAATCSSAACIPVNIEAARKMGVSDSVAEGLIPLGINLHKDGSVISTILKVVFLMSLFGLPWQGAGSFFLFFGAALLVGCVMGAVPTGGMTGELMLCTLFGFPPEMAASLMIIGAIIDMPATVVNSTANITAAVVADRLIGPAKRRG